MTRNSFVDNYPKIIRLNATSLKTDSTANNRFWFGTFSEGVRQLNLIILYYIILYYFSSVNLIILKCKQLFIMFTIDINFVFYNFTQI